MLNGKNQKLILSAQKAIINTLLYSDIFSFPLTEKELWFFLKSDKKIPKNLFRKSIGLLVQKKLIHYDSFYALHDRKSLINLRKKRTAISSDKLRQAQKISRILHVIPTVMCIGVSGSLASMNAKAEDDIDFFLITREKTMWISRLLVLGILALSGKRRRKTDTEAANKYCVNMILTDDALAFPKERQDVYTAHEIAQLVPLESKQQTYQRFLSNNTWINLFLPNVPIPTVKEYKKTTTFSFMTKLFQLCDPFAKLLQLYSIKKTRTNEIISFSVLAFHPQDHRIKVLQKYANQVQKTRKNR